METDSMISNLTSANMTATRPSIILSFVAVMSFVNQSITYIGIFNSLLICCVFARSASIRAISELRPILYLAVSDALYCVSAAVSFAMRMAHTSGLALFSRLSCLSIFNVIRFLQRTSLLLLLYIAVDRLRAVISPIRYRALNHKRNATIAASIIALTFVPDIITTYVQLDDWYTSDEACYGVNNMSVTYLSVTGVLSTVIVFAIIVVYVMMIYFYGSLKKKIQPETQDNVDGELIANTPTTAKMSETEKRRNREITKLVMAAAGACVLFYGVPWVAYVIFVMIVKIKGPIVALLLKLIGTGNALNAASNVYIYVLYNQTFRDVLKKLFCIKSANNANNNILMVAAPPQNKAIGSAMPAE